MLNPSEEEPAQEMRPAVTKTAKSLSKTTDKYLYFYDHKGSEPANTFSQWYPSPFVERDEDRFIKFATTEHYMMYCKAQIMHDEKMAEQILKTESPADVKRLGRQVKNFDQGLWDKKCDEVVVRGNWLKFSQVEKCQLALLSTGDRTIVEASSTDRIWGIGFSADNAEGKEAEWGENKLGKALMEVRDKIRRGELALARWN